MADLKAGTTVGGNTIWSQANLPLLPSGNTITYKGYKVYTENDKPTKAEIGLGNVTNDAQVKKAGDEMTGDLTLKNNTQLTVPRRINLVADTAGNAGTAPYLLTTRSDNNAVTDPFPSQHTRTFTLFVNTKSNTSDPAGGANLAALLSHQATTGRVLSNCKHMMHQTRQQALRAFYALRLGLMAGMVQLTFPVLR